MLLILQVGRLPFKLAVSHLASAFGSDLACGEGSGWSLSGSLGLSDANASVTSDEKEFGLECEVAVEVIRGQLQGHDSPYRRGWAATAQSVDGWCCYTWLISVWGRLIEAMSLSFERLAIECGASMW